MEVSLRDNPGRLRAESAPRHVLITDFDLYRNLGGGQTVYHRLVALRPQDRFYYFTLREQPDAPRPANTVAIPFAAHYAPAKEILPPGQLHLLISYCEARNLAASIVAQLGRRDFDVVDVPDYSQRGVFIRAALEAEGIRCGTVAIALHGTLSSAWGAGWPSPSNAEALLDELRHKERLQYAAADARYGISAAYADEWQAVAAQPVNLVDPLAMLTQIDPQPARPRAGAPDLVFIGRRERWKGPDLFLDIAWCVGKDLYRRLVLAGPDGPNHAGVGSANFLGGIARLRGLKPEIPGALSKAQIEDLVRSRTVLLLPSRHDTFNLMALEALAAGCPVLVSRHAGVARWILTNLPELAWLVIDIDCARTAAEVVSETLAEYDARRAEVVAAMRRLRASQPGVFDAAYRHAAEADVEGRQEVAELALRFSTLARLAPRSALRRFASGAVRGFARSAGPVLKSLPGRLAGRVLRPLGSRLRPLLALRRGGLHWNSKEAIKRAIREWTGLSPRTMQQVVHSRYWHRVRRTMLAQPETSREEAQAKLAQLAARVPSTLVNRVPLFAEMGRLERRLGNDLVAATYALRVMRWLGQDRFGELPFVRATLQQNGFTHEAETAAAMFGPEAEREERCLALMQDAYRRNQGYPDLPLAVMDDRRGETPRRVAVIVSLYNAADKLPTLLGCLAQQSIAKRGELEVVLVDSNSPKDERAALEGFLAQRDLPVLYARSEGRETIQKAWNRGIRLARAPYLAFLGADEGLHPDALRQLADALDRDPRADWAMSDSIVTDVDENGIYAGDVMPYDRTGYRQDLVYLETCYLSWVGGLYRRSIHDRFGYYDESYRAAGDTEFKNRMMPHIRSVHVPGMLGVFNNYPEERTTAHPRAEIEDLRAWYLWRSVAGMRYAFAERPAEEAMALLRTALNYRKSYCMHLSSDFDLADSLARYLLTRPDAPQAGLRDMAAATGQAVAMLQQLDLLPPGAARGPGGVGTMRHVLGQVRAANRRMAPAHQALFGLDAKPYYELFNDNRYEQHWWSWSG